MDPIKQSDADMIQSKWRGGNDWHSPRESEIKLAAQLVLEGYLTVLTCMVIKDCFIADIPNIPYLASKVFAGVVIDNIRKRAKDQLKEILESLTHVRALK